MNSAERIFKCLTSYIYIYYKMNNCTLSKIVTHDQISHLEYLLLICMWETMMIIENFFEEFDTTTYRILLSVNGGCFEHMRMCVCVSYSHFYWYRSSYSQIMFHYHISMLSGGRLSLSPTTPTSTWHVNLKIK